MGKQLKKIPFDPAAHLKRSLKNPEFKAVYDALGDEIKLLPIVAPIGRKPGSAKADVLYIAEDFDAPLSDF